MPKAETPLQRSKIPLIFHNKLAVIISIVAVLLCIGFAAFFGLSKETEQPYLTINDQRINLEVADTPEKRATGLSGRPSLEPRTGMLFIYESPAQPGFWMKDMQFPLDIIWINEAKEVADIDANISPDTYPESFKPSAPIIYVLEINGGEAESLNVEVGQPVSFKL